MKMIERDLLAKRVNEGKTKTQAIMDMGITTGTWRSFVKNPVRTYNATLVVIARYFGITPWEAVERALTDVPGGGAAMK